MVGGERKEENIMRMNFVWWAVEREKATFTFCKLYYLNTIEICSTREERKIRKKQEEKKAWTSRIKEKKPFMYYELAKCFSNGKEATYPNIIPVEGGREKSKIACSMYQV